MRSIVLQVNATASPDQIRKLAAKAKSLGAVSMSRRFPRDRDAEIRRLFLVVPGAGSDPAKLQSALGRESIVTYAEPAEVVRRLVKPIRSSTGKSAINS